MSETAATNLRYTVFCWHPSDNRTITEANIVMKCCCPVLAVVGNNDPWDDCGAICMAANFGWLYTVLCWTPTGHASNGQNMVSVSTNQSMGMQQSPMMQQPQQFAMQPMVRITIFAFKLHFWLLSIDAVTVSCNGVPLCCFLPHLNAQYDTA